MKYFLAANDVVLEDLPRGKVRLHASGDDFESIWVAVDEPNGKMYFLNAPLHLHPFPSWGTELDLSLGQTIDIDPIRGATPDEGKLTVHRDMYDHIVEYLAEDGEFDAQRYFDDIFGKHEEDPNVTYVTEIVKTDEETSEGDSTL